MKLILPLLLLSTVCFSQGSFRSFEWGTHIDEIKKNETLQPSNIELDNALIFEGQVGGLKAFVMFIFLEDSLVRGKYVFDETHSNKTDFILDFKKVAKKLAENYAVVKEEVFWRNDLYKDNPEQYGFAVSLGHLVYYNEYMAAGTEIVTALTGENYKISHAVEYVSTKYKPKVEAAEKKKATNDF